MKSVSYREIPAPPSLIKALKAGFDSVTNHIGLIAFPILLDILLWFGPHLRFKNLITNLADQMLSMPGLDAPDTADMVRLAGEFWALVAERMNIFFFLRSFPVGVPSLMVSRQPIETPLGSPVMKEISSFGEVAGLVVFFTLLGLFVGALYFALVAQAAVNGKVDWRQALVRWPRNAAQVLVLALFWLAVIFAVTIPGICALTALSFAGPLISQVGIFLYAGIVLWSLFPLFFSPHGIFIHRTSMWESVKQGVRLTRYTITKTSLLFLIIFVAGQGLDVLWSVPDENAWLSVVGIAGHAFVVTGLLAGSFVYYQDAHRWVQRFLQTVKLAGQ
jgi:hypothetical protein